MVECTRLSRFGFVVVLALTPERHLTYGTFVPLISIHSIPDRDFCTWLVDRDLGLPSLPLSVPFFLPLFSARINLMLLQELMLLTTFKAAGMHALSTTVIHAELVHAFLTPHPGLLGLILCRPGWWALLSLIVSFVFSFASAFSFTLLLGSPSSMLAVSVPVASPIVGRHILPFFTSHFPAQLDRGLGIILHLDSSTLEGFSFVVLSLHHA